MLVRGRDRNRWYGLLHLGCGSRFDCRQLFLTYRFLRSSGGSLGSRIIAHNVENFGNIPDRFFDREQRPVFLRRRQPLQNVQLGRLQMSYKFGNIGDFRDRRFRWPGVPDIPAPSSAAASLYPERSGANG